MCQPEQDVWAFPDAASCTLGLGLDTRAGQKAHKCRCDYAMVGTVLVRPVSEFHCRSEPRVSQWSRLLSKARSAASGEVVGIGRSSYEAVNRDQGSGTPIGGR